MTMNIAFPVRLVLLLTPLLLLQDEATRFNNEAVQLIEREELDQALVKLKQALDLAPESEVIKKNLATVYARRGVNRGNQGNYRAAVADLQASLFHLPAQSEYHFLLATFLFRLGDLQRAESEVKKSLQGSVDKETKMQAKSLEGNIYYLDNRLDKALAAFQAAQQIEPSDRSVQEMLTKVEQDRLILRDYYEDKTNYFTLYYDRDSLTLKSDGPFICLLEDERSRVCMDFNHFPRKTITVILYTPEDFKKVTASENWVGGLFDRKIRIPLSELNQQNLETIREVVRHEYTHFVIYDLAPSCPVWVNEGLACCGQHEKGRGRKMVLELMADGHSLLPFEQMPSTFMQISNPDLVRRLYIQSHAMMEYLVAYYGYSRVRQLLKELKKGEDWQAAFEKSYHRSFKRLERDWRERLE